MILKKLSSSDVGKGGQLAVNLPKGQIEFFNIEKLDNKSNLPNQDYQLVFIERSSSKRHDITLSYKPGSKQWRIIGLSNTKEFFQKEKITEGDYLIINNSSNKGEFLFEVHKLEDNQEFSDFLLIYFYLIKGMPFRALDKNIYKVENQNGSKSYARLKNTYNITDDIKKSFNENGIEKEYSNSRDKYRNALEVLKKYYQPIKKIKTTNPLIMKGINKIYFGAPGTGKSFQITEDLKGVENVFQERVTFHPEYDNASFVGGYKPITDKNGDIKYEFVPQIFTNIYIKACNNPDHQYYLIIEEINRGNCAEIFGELFQLLDRDPKYYITPSNELLTYLENNISIQSVFKDGKMLLPDNLSILATMNTSDQSLFPMDSAFKRRWEWEYIPINYEKDVAKNRSANFNIKMPDGSLINWIDFIEKVNQRIQNNRNLGMDKCIGNYFVKPDENDIITVDQFIYKVMFYLWNDVFKDEPTDSIFKGDISYQDFFPIEGKGKDLINSIFIDLKIIEEPIEETAETETEG